MKALKEWLDGGTPWIWLNGGAVALSLIMVIGLLLLIAVRGLGHFWPSVVVETTYTHSDGREIRVLGELVQSETVTAAVMRDAGFDLPADQDIATRHMFKLGNRDVTGTDFRWFSADNMGAWRYPNNVVVLERTEWGDFYGYMRSVREGERTVAEGEAAWAELDARVERAASIRREIERLERREIGTINHRLDQLRLQTRRLELRGVDDPSEHAAIETERERLLQLYADIEERRNALLSRLDRDHLVAETMEGREVVIPVANIVRASRPNAMSFWQKVGHYISSFKEFITGYPREANTEGGIFPAIFGTMIMVILMSIIVTPFGVLSAIYLTEYARQGPVVRLIRICVNNLAGVPSIVFGVFGLGFFVYFTGGGIDRIFFPESLPAPTFGTPGLFWASLTLALLTLPVVIVSTEEGLSRIPRNLRDGSLALGATKAETLWRVVVPMSAPAMMTGLILAVARAAGEVAPLMLVGVVKLAPSLPVDFTPPYLHLERQFMHLGFHIYDVGFQSPNVEAARPLVYATALILVLLIITLNLTAVSIRNRLREKYKNSGH